MVYAKIDSILYKVVWYYGAASGVDITPYIQNHSSYEGITIENNKIELQFKLVRDKAYSKEAGTFMPFFANADSAKNMLSTNSFLVVYVKYDDGTPINIDSDEDRLKTYYVTDWNLSEPSNKVTISAVDLQYKIVNRNTSRVFSERKNSTSTGISGAVLTDSTESFELPSGTGKYENGYKWMTLEVTQSGTTDTYLITSNTATTVTVHKNITQTTGATYRIGESSPYAVWQAIHESAMNRAGQGEDFIECTADPTTDYGTNYRTGIQFLRPDNSAFPIIDIGQSYFPIYKLIKEVSGFSACNTETELADPDALVCVRDMIFAINWDDEEKKAVTNWFYLAQPVEGTTYTTTVVSDDEITVSGASSSDIGAIARVKMIRTINSVLTTIYRNYTILDLTANTYTFSSDAETDGVAVGDTFTVYKGVDFIWDNEHDFKHVNNLKLGSTDEEQFNHVLFDCGYNTVGERTILGHWFNEETKSDTIKDTFIPMTHIVKNMLKFCRLGADGTQKVIKHDQDKWYGWDNGASAFTDVDADWDFTTTFGTNDTYTIASRSDFNKYLKEAARKSGVILAKSLVSKQKENTLKGTIQARGQKFLSVGSSSNTIGRWYQKGSRILFKKANSGLVNEGDSFYNFVVSKIRQQIDSTRWTVFLDVEYSKYSMEELLQ